MTLKTSETTVLPAWFSGSSTARLVAGIYGAIIAFRNALYDALPRLSYRAARPVISVGGIRAGGAGKTPLAIFIGNYLNTKGCSVAFLSRGYGRTGRSLRIVKPGESVPWDEVGDEPWLLHDRIKTSWLGISGDRRASARIIAPHLPAKGVFVLDDGFQHRAMRRDLDIVCLHAAPFSDRLIPAGNLREGPAALRRAKCVVLIGTSDSYEELNRHRRDLARAFPHLTVCRAFQRPRVWVNAKNGTTAETPPLEDPVLVCGIARPERFTEMVRSNGIRTSAELIFPDHHRYAINDFNKTRELYSKGVITTEKDAVRLKYLGVVPQDALWYLTIEIEFVEKTDKKEFELLIDKIIQ